MISQFTLTLHRAFFDRMYRCVVSYFPFALIGILSGISLIFFLFYLTNGLGLAYNDARSHLDIGRRVVEGLKPGLAQLGSVWLPLPHLLMIPTVWHDTLWHTGFSGALQSGASFVATAYFIFLFLELLGVGWGGRLLGVLVFVLNLNVLYLQSTAMTELLLIFTMTAGVYFLVLFEKRRALFALIQSSFFIMLSTLIRYDGWFLLFYSVLILGISTYRRSGYKATEGLLILFTTLGGIGISLWFLWNLLIFKDPLYFVLGPFSARSQQQQLESAGVLSTKGNFLFSLKVYLYALMYNSGAFTALLGLFGAVLLGVERRIHWSIRAACSALLAPLFFNILALYLGHSVLFVQGLSGDTWFNVRYGIMMLPSIAIFTGYLFEKARNFRFSIVGLLLFVTFFSFANGDAVTIDDARVGSSQKNVTEVSSWLREHAGPQDGFILISAASHDAIIFSSGLAMRRFIHEGTGEYWELATTGPEHWARWIVMRTHDENDLTFRAVSKTPGYALYDRVASFPFADVYQIQPAYWDEPETRPVLGKQK